MLSFVKESPEGVSPLCTGVTPGSISKWQGGLFAIAHESASLCRGAYALCRNEVETTTEWSNKPTGKSLN
ncbi:hypothetical protein BZG01_20305 [Labilibaculum manganireducens]|uniref:Uncharacterized protein n=1 Tax=Labilibaculum manganireducens TaxID=1940525 RepID=A0A2N3HRY7_9BACT|nr:hypothetical protein BZG01_20305 [Labilibaculum manganireducens]